MSLIYIAASSYKKTMDSILLKYRREVEEDTGKQIPELCYELEAAEAIEETKVENRGEREVLNNKS